MNEVLADLIDIDDDSTTPANPMFFKLGMNGE